MTSPLCTFYMVMKRRRLVTVSQSQSWKREGLIFRIWRKRSQEGQEKCSQNQGNIYGICDFFYRIRENVYLIREIIYRNTLSVIFLYFSTHFYFAQRFDHLLLITHFPMSFIHVCCVIRYHNFSNLKWFYYVTYFLDFTFIFWRLIYHIFKKSDENVYFLSFFWIC